ncbi:MAG TPA: hypothetical protein ENJ29_10360 [Bacteroidetes bacterium]|nr:hypothetical protein [Bacteroidota bacterium]
MVSSTSHEIAFYLFTFLFIALFILQLWAIMRIKTMLRRVAEIYDWVRAGKMGQQDFGQSAQTYSTTCQHCIYRTVYLSRKKPFNFVHHCRKTDKKIKLEDSCLFFKLDPHSIEN